MSDASREQLVRSGDAPDDAELEQWMGTRAHARWQRVRERIEREYPGVFAPDWLYGGKKHGWSLRYKKSRSFCTLIPQRGGFALVIVFGAQEREQVETIRGRLSASTLRIYDQAHTYHDGKWVRLDVDNAGMIEEVFRLLAIKRKSKPVAG